MTLTNAHAAFVFDHLEQERPEELYPAVFTIRADEVVELNPELRGSWLASGPRLRLTSAWRSLWPGDRRPQAFRCTKRLAVYLDCC